MRPDEIAHDAYAPDRQDHSEIRRRRLLTQAFQTGRDYSKRWQNYNVNLGMTEKPEKMLKRYCISGRVEAQSRKSAVAKMAFEKENGDACTQDWQCRDEEDGYEENRSSYQVPAQRRNTAIPAQLQSG